MSCDEISELLAAYALDALDGDEQAAVDDHLRSCRRHDAELAEQRLVVERMTTTREPSPELRARLLDAFDAEVAQKQPVDLPGFRRIAARRQLAWPAAAAALLIAAVGLAAWGLVLQVNDGSAGAQLTAFAGEAGSGQLIYLPDDQIAVLQLDLAPADAGHSYQAWGVFEGETLSLGLVPNEGVAAFRSDLSSARAVAVSVEPLGGSEQPTTEPVLVATLG